jgi:hypothetical protein
VARITKIYDPVRGFDCMNKAGICELLVRVTAIVARKQGRGRSPNLASRWREMNDGKKRR